MTPIPYTSEAFEAPDILLIILGLIKVPIPSMSSGAMYAGEPQNVYVD